MVAASFLYFDLPVAARVYGLLGHAKTIGTGFSSEVLLSAEAAIALGLMINRILRGHLSPFREATALACLTSMCAYTINDSVLKLVFGVPNPSAVMHGSQHVFNLLGGSSMSSFPSGHMVLAAAFGGVFMRLYRSSVKLLSALLFAGAVLMVVGDWHFVSDVIAGAFIGVSAGAFAGELWLVHSA
jgi:membrane-associated phospholipid phosphatase